MALTDLFSDIADAIREKDGTTDDIVASDFPDRIRSIPSGGVDFSISIVSPPSKTNYYVGDTIETTGLVVNGTFDDGLSFNIPLSYLSISPTDSLTDSDNKITITYAGKTCYQTIIVIEKHDVFGVMWDYANSSTALTRLTPSNDPYNFVTTTVSSEPVSAVGTTGGSSPFDNYLPWTGMEEYNIVGSTVGAKQGESGFSRTANDVMVYIPEFWYKCIDDSTNSKRYWYISDTETNGFEKHPGSGKYVSRYTANSSYKSISGNQSVVSITRATARTNAKAKGTGWQLYDFASLCAVQFLYLVEYADWNSQEKVGRGYVDVNSAQINTGATDGMTYHTGIAAGTNGKTAMQYRHIENMWGNLYQFVDGINFSNRNAYVCLNPEHYADDTSTNYTDTGITLPSSNGYIKGLGYSANNDWCLIPNTIGGSENTYIPDYVYSSTGWRILCVCGDFPSVSYAGAWFIHGSLASTDTRAAVGVRLLYTP